MAVRYLPSPGDYCPCNIRADRLPACDGQGGTDARHDNLNGNTCWNECRQVSTGICGAQRVCKWEPLQRCVGGDLSNQKAGAKLFAAVEMVSKSLAAAQADAGDGSDLVHKFLNAAGTQIAASDLSHSCMMTLTIRLGSRLWISECRVQSNPVCGMIALQSYREYMLQPSR